MTKAIALCSLLPMPNSKTVAIFRWILSLLASIGLVLSFFVHVMALRGIPVQEHEPMVWALHIGVPVVFFPMLIYLRRVQEYDPDGVCRGVPLCAMAAFGVLILYVFFNFHASKSLLDVGSPEYRNGAYILQFKGRIIREISEAEYRSVLAAQLRAFSGHWLLFYAFPFLVFLFLRDTEDA